MGMEERTDLGFETRKEKKRHKEKRKKDELGSNSSLIEVSGDKMGEVVKVQTFKKNDGTSIKIGEGGKKKKKRKRDVDGPDIEIQMNLTMEKDLVGDCENLSGKIMEGIDFTDTEKKRKKLFEDDKLGEVARSSKCSKDRDITEMNNVEVVKTKKKKEKREKVAAEVLQNIITDGKEAGVESEHSNGQVKKANKNQRNNSISEMQETVVEKPGRKNSTIQKNRFFEKDSNACATGGETNTKTREDMDEEDGNKRKKRAKSEKRGTALAIGYETSTKTREDVNEEDGNKRKQRAKSEKHGYVHATGDETSTKAREDVNKEDGNKRKKRSKSEKHGNACATGDETSTKTRDDVNEEDSTIRKKRAKSEKHVNKGHEEKKKKSKSDEGSLRTQKDVTAPDLSESSTPLKTPKRVSFSDEVEVFTPFDDSEDAEGAEDAGKPEDAGKGLVFAKWFSKKEDELIKRAVYTYIKEHQLGSEEEGIKKILKCKQYPEIRNCWKHIAAALPWRPYRGVYSRAHNLFERSVETTWTEEELNEVKRAYEESEAKGEPPNWTKVAEKLGKYRVHVKDAYRRIKLANMKKGHWSQQEYQTLFDLVNKDLQMRALEEKKSKHGMLRDNVGWEAISQNLGTRTNAICCQKWYYQLSSPLVAEGEWSDADDYRLVYALDSLDAFCIDDVDWDDLLEHRPGDVCRKRWNQMVKHIGQHGTKTFAEQVGILSKRYCAEALEAREVYDSMPAVD